METRIFKDNEATARAFAQFLKEKTIGNKSLSIALSGGSTPKALFKILATDYKNEIDWSNLHFYWGDERMVAPDHEESNYKMTYDLLFSQLPIPKANIHRIRGENTLKDEVTRYAEEIDLNLPKANGLPVFDIIMLGMGADGHTASIFPPDLHLIGDKGICAIGTNPESGQKRVTLTGPVINNARHICFLVTGIGKSEKIDEIFNKKGEFESYPAAHIVPKNGSITWFLDESASSKLN